MTDPSKSSNKGKLRGLRTGHAVTARAAQALGNRARLADLRHPTPSAFVGPTPQHASAEVGVVTSAANPRRWLTLSIAAGSLLLGTAFLAAALIMYWSPSEAASTSGPAVENPTWGEPPNVPALVEQVIPSTVTIECGAGFGSGFLLSPVGISTTPDEVLITNDHVIRDCLATGMVTVRSELGPFQSTIMATDQQHDLALIDPSGLGLPAMRVAPEPIVGQWVLAVGSPLGYDDSVSPGMVTHVQVEDAVIATNAVLAPGNSGGPLVDNQGRVLGVNFAVWREAESIGLSRDIRAICITLLPCS